MKTIVRSVYLLDGGTLEVESSMVVAGRDFGQLMRVPVQTYLLDTSRGYVLIDTGNNPGVITDPVAAWGAELAAGARPRMEPRNHPYEQLSLLGVGAADVTSVIYTHLHHDHAGGASLFPGAQHIVQRAEWRWASSPDDFASRPYVRTDFDRPDLSWMFVDGDLNVMPGIHLVSTPGHSPGHQSIVLWDAPGLGTLIIAGDAINCQSNIDGNVPPGLATDPGAAMHSMSRLVALAEATGATILNGHDMEQFAAMPKAPHPLSAPGPLVER
jgi:glyoxylase-like metal-dependent hydrolase (beta-lactamase superfamily II)